MVSAFDLYRQTMLDEVLIGLDLFPFQSEKNLKRRRCKRLVIYLISFKELFKIL